MRRRRLMLAAGLVAMLAGASLALADDRLAYMEREQDGIDGVEALANCVALTASDDGRHLYAISSGEGAVSVFARDRSGTLSLVEVEQDGVNGVSFLWGAFGGALSADGKNIYVVTRSDSSIVTFARDAETGKLTFVEADVQGIGGVAGMLGGMSVTVSPDGLHVYAVGGDSNAVAAFARDPLTGALSYAGAVFEGDASPNGTVAGLVFPEKVIASPDSLHVYVMGSLSSAVAMFARDSDTGLLTFLGTSTTGISLPIGAAISPDGKHVYVANYGGGGSVAILERNAQTGWLTRIGAQWDGVGGVDGLAAAIAVSVSPSGKLVAVAGRDDNAVAIFRRDLTTGLLTFVEAQLNGSGGVGGLQFVGDVAFGAEDRNVYTAGWTEGTVASFAVVLYGDNFETGTTGRWFATVGAEP
jgi:6-phosphogluconolactonase (cycloisomerase 2 family)